MRAPQTTPGGARPNRRAGFTLVELLVVTGIIAVLASMLLPALARSTQTARGVQCIGNMRQLILGWLLYADENDGRLCPSNPGSRSGWISGIQNFDSSNRDNTNTTFLLDGRYARLGPYLQNAGFFKCPSDRSFVRMSGTRHPRVRSVAMNPVVGLPSIDQGLPANREFRLFQNASQILEPTPDRLWVLVDEHPDSIDDGSFTVDLKSRGPAAYLYSWPANFHGNGANFAFADGHVERHRWIDSRTYHANLYCGCLSSYAANGYFTPSPGSRDVAWLQDHTSAPLTAGSR